jgi:hypothetical protein
MERAVAQRDAGGLRQTLEQHAALAPVAKVADRVDPPDGSRAGEDRSAFPAHHDADSGKSFGPELDPEAVRHLEPGDRDLRGRRDGQARRVPAQVRHVGRAPHVGRLRKRRRGKQGDQPEGGAKSSVHGPFLPLRGAAGATAGGSVRGPAPPRKWGWADVLVADDLSACRSARSVRHRIRSNRLLKKSVLFVS